MEKHCGRLWAAVIAQAVQDACGIIESQVGGRTERRRVRDAAMRWLFSASETGTGSLSWICDHTGLNIECVRRFAREKVNERKLPAVFRQGIKRIGPDVGKAYRREARVSRLGVAA